MSQAMPPAPPSPPPPMYPPAPTGFQRFCPTCGLALPGPAQRCPRCGAFLAAAPQGRNTAVTVAVVLIVGMIGISCVGILAAIAIPNFLRFQLRAKQSQVTVELSALAKAEAAYAARTGNYLRVEAIPAAQAPGTQKVAFTADELKLAQELDWIVEGATYGQYRVAVSEAGQAASLCGESDIDGDGERAAYVAFLPGQDGEEPPPAPCASPVPYAEQYGSGEVVRVSGDNVF